MAQIIELNGNKYEPRDYLLNQGEMQDTDKEFWVVWDEPYSEFHMDELGYPVEYYYYRCIYQGEQKFLEQRIGMDENGYQQITETIVSSAPKNEGG